MTPEVVYIPVPQHTANDEACRLVDVLCEAGEVVREGQEVAVMESSKAAFSIDSPADGYVYTLADEASMVPVGETVAVVSRRPLAPQALEALRSAAQSAGSNPGGDERPGRFSRSARELMRLHGIEESAFDGKPLIRKSDVEAKIHQTEQRVTISSPLTQESSSLANRAVDNGVLLLGGGGHAREVIEILNATRHLRPVGIIDDNPAVAGSVVDGVPVLGFSGMLADLLQQGLCHMVLAFGSLQCLPARRRRYLELKRMGFRFPTLIHPRATVARSAQIGEGVQIMANSYVGAGCVIHDCSIINTGAIVSHECVIGSNAHLAPGSVLAGDVRVGENSLIGMGSTVYLGVRIGEGACLKNGTHVFSDVQRTGRTMAA